MTIEAVGAQVLGLVSRFGLREDNGPLLLTSSHAYAHLIPPANIINVRHTFLSFYVTLSSRSCAVRVHSADGVGPRVEQIQSDWHCLSQLECGAHEWDDEGHAFCSASIHPIHLCADSVRVRVHVSLSAQGGMPRV